MMGSPAGAEGTVLLADLASRYSSGVWVFTLALLICLGIDFSNPLLPGVVRFGEEESVNALRAERSRTDERPARALPPADPMRFVDVAMTVPRPTTGRLDRSRPQSASSRPRASIDAVPRTTTGAEDH
jgi:hypothetical protein